MSGEESAILDRVSEAREEAMNESRSGRRNRGGAARIERVGLWALALFNAAAVLGFATFGVHPEWLSSFPAAVPVFAVSFRLFSIGQILLAAAVLIFVLTRRTGLAWVPAFLAIYAISLGSELAGTAVGFPFGDYRYTTVLGARWFDLVPLVIPLSWFMMAVPSYLLARRLAPAGGLVSRVVLGALVLTAWDLALDPAMSHATYYWVWETEGAYYGMPWVNLFGWLLTSALLMLAMIRLGAERWVPRLPTGWIAGFYAVNLLLALGMSAGAGLYGAVLLTLGAYGALLALGARNRRAASEDAMRWS